MNWSKMRNPAFLTALAVLVTGAVGLSQVIRVRGLHLTKEKINAPDNLQFHSLPSKYTGWEQLGRDEEMSKEAIEELGTANTISRVYQEITESAEQRPRRIEVHIAYYTGMIDTVPHVPERCMVGSGWTKDGQTVPVDVPLDMARLGREGDLDSDVHGVSSVYTARAFETGTRVRLPKGIENLQMSVTPFVHSSKRQRFAGYFFIANGGVVASANQVRLLAFKLDEKYAFYCKVQFSSMDVTSAQELGAVAGAMLDEMLGDIMRRVPDWIEVEAGRYPPPESKSKV
jgi:hypothetical protein